MGTIPGLKYIAQYIDKAQEQALLDTIGQHPWNTKFKRRRQIYGVIDTMARKWVTPEKFLGPLPNWGAVVAEDLYAHGIMPRVPEQLLINEYLPGQGITFHRDAFCYEDTIVSLSLGTAYTMEFMRLEDGKRVQKYLDPRSLLVLTGTARWDWKHAIPKRKSDVVKGKRVLRGRRISMTFRNVFMKEKSPLISP